MSFHFHINIYEFFFNIFPEFRHIEKSVFDSTRVSPARFGHIREILAILVAHVIFSVAMRCFLHFSKLFFEFHNNHIKSLVRYISSSNLT